MCTTSEQRLPLYNSFFDNEALSKFRREEGIVASKKEEDRKCIASETKGKTAL